MTNSPHNKDNAELSAGDEIQGYKVEQVVEISEINSIYYRLEHIATGARHIHIKNSDEENTFGVAFKTVPHDSTGVAHILEHTVLCGSKKFPVRDPFFSMLKRSLNTFMNAFTASDWTMYPFSTQNRKDFYNLMDVYLDAAFFPNLSELSFRQEGHRLETETDSDVPDNVKLVFKGVVYNEMKGAMSSQDQIMARSILNAMYPDTTYHYNSGGDPLVIPELSYEQLVAFHKRHYHPSNAYFYTYGNLPLEDHLTVISEKILTQFDRIDPKTDVPSQARWQEPVTARYTYPIAENEDTEKKSQVALAWLVPDITDSFEVLSFTLLEQILLGNSASPLRKALIDSQLGTALSDGVGFDADNRDTLFACGLKGVSESKADEISSIIFSVLKDLEKNGIDDILIASAIHQIEFHRKEITNTPYPYGIKLLLTFTGSWLHGGAPEKILRFDADLEKLKKELKKGGFFEKQIRKYFLDNPHRALILLAPDKEKAAEDEKKIADRLARMKETISQDDIDSINSMAVALQELQEKEEDLSCLPTLEIKDIPKEIKIVNASSELTNSPIFCYDQPTSDIFYFTAAVGAGRLPSSLLPLMPFFCSAFTRVGTSDHDYTEIARLIDRYTGGIGMNIQAGSSFADNAGTCLPFVTFGGKCLTRNLDHMFTILQELLTRFNFSDLSRLKSLLFEYQAGLESMIIRNGHRYALLLASRNFSQSNHLSELWHGIHQLITIREITNQLTNADNAEQVLEKLAQNLVQIGRATLTTGNMKVALIGEHQTLAPALDATSAIQQALPKASASGFVEPEFTFDPFLPKEGWSTSSSVSFVARSFRTVRMIHEDAPALAVISKILRSMYLHREIREKGGAYGGFSLYHADDGLFSLASYRDPHIYSTFKAFDGAVSFIRSGAYTEEDIKEAILQVCSEIDKPDTPGPSARKSFFRKIVSLSDETRRKYKSHLLSLNRKQIISVAEKYFHQVPGEQAEVVISGEDKLTTANTKLPTPLSLHKI